MINIINIIDYLNIDKECELPIETISQSQYLKENYFKIGERERASLLNFLIISNFCYAFKIKPIVYEQITQYISDKFNVSKSNIVLIGSARTGFAIDPENYGRKFSEESDLDFAIIDKEVFKSSVVDFKLWKSRTEKNEYEEKVRNKYWTENLSNLRFQIKKGFIDTYKIPNFPEFVTTQQLNASLSLIVINLKEYQNIKVKKASVRIYKDWHTFQKQLRLNIESVLNKL